VVGVPPLERSREWGRAVSLLRLADTTVSAIARRLGVNWHTCWNAVKKHAKTSIDIKKRPSGVNPSHGCRCHLAVSVPAVLVGSRVVLLLGLKPEEQVKDAWISLRSTNSDTWNSTVAAPNCCSRF